MGESFERLERFRWNTEQFAWNDWNGERNAERFSRNDWNGEQNALNGLHGTVFWSSSTLQGL
jgi:hypothetical protein